MLLVATTLGAQPAPAAEPTILVYELTRPASDRSRGDVYAYVLTDTGGAPGVMSALQLAPRKGGGWTEMSFMVGMYNPTDTQLAAYGGPVSQPVPCTEVPDVCGEAPSPYLTVWRVRFRPVTGHRYFIAGVASHFGIYAPPTWRVRQSSLGARAVHARGGESSTTAGAVGNGTRIEALQSVTAPGGKYGSSVFARVPCDKPDGIVVGSASIKSDGSDKAVPISCDPAYYGFSDTTNGRTWTLSGPMAGEYVFKLRLFVFDHPKR